MRETDVAHVNGTFDKHPLPRTDVAIASTLVRLVLASEIVLIEVGVGV